MVRRAGRRILGAGGDRGRAISGRGFNHFNLLRRHFRATGDGAAQTCAPCVPFVPSAMRREATETFGRWSWRFQYQILGVQGCGAHTISGREFNLFKPLRHHFRASPLCRQALPRRDQNAAVQETDDRPLPPGLRQARHAPRLDPSGASGSSGNGNSFDGTGHSAFSFRAAEKNKCRTVIQPCQEIVGRFGRGEFDAGFHCDPKNEGPRQALHNRRCRSRTRSSWADIATALAGAPQALRGLSAGAPPTAARPLPR